MSEVLKENRRNLRRLYGKRLKGLSLSAAPEQRQQSPRLFWLSLRGVAFLPGRAIAQWWNIANVIHVQNFWTFS
jgi:hypothetical protein